MTFHLIFLYRLRAYGVPLVKYPTLWRRFSRDM